MNTRILGIALGALTLLSACSEREIILPGQREDIRAESEDVPVALRDNEARAIRLAGQTSNASWTQRIGTPSTRVAHPALRDQLQLVWSTNIGVGDKRKARISADPVVAGGRIFTLDSAATVVATGTGGQRLWERDLTPPQDKSGEASGGGLATDGERLFVASGFGVLVALDAATGAELWTQQLGAATTSAPAVFGDLVYVVSGDSTGWAVRKSDGRVQWQSFGSPDVGSTFGGAAPSINDKLAVFAFGSGEMQGVFRRGGLQLWSTSLAGQRRGVAVATISGITGDPVVSGDKIYVGTNSGRLIAAKLDSGERLWTAPDGVVNPVWPAGDSVFAVTDRNELVRFDAGDGSRVWSVELPLFVKERPRRLSEVFVHHGPVMAGGRLLVASSDGSLRSFDPRDGSLLSVVEIPRGATTNPVVAGGTLYLVSTSGDLHAFR